MHDLEYLHALEDFCANGGGKADPDTYATGASWDAARLAAGAGLAAVDALARGEGEVAFSVARPPGHHALANRAMGFCLVNNVAVAAATLANAGERVVIVGEGEEVFARHAARKPEPLSRMAVPLASHRLAGTVIILPREVLGKVLLRCCCGLTLRDSKHSVVILRTIFHSCKADVFPKLRLGVWRICTP